MLDSVLIRRAWRFGATGVATTGVHALVAILMMHYVGPSQTIANGVAFVMATLFSYCVNTAWSFSASMRGKNLWRYSVTAAIGLLLALSVSAISQKLGWHYLVGIILISSVLPPVNFLMHHFWTYNDTEMSKDKPNGDQ